MRSSIQPAASHARPPAAIDHAPRKSPSNPRSPVFPSLTFFRRTQRTQATQAPASPCLSLRPSRLGEKPSSLPACAFPAQAVIVEVDKPRVMQSPVLSREEELYWLALKLVPGLGTRTSGKLLDRFRTPQAIFRASRTELEGAGVSGAVAQSIASGCTFEDAADAAGEDGAMRAPWLVTIGDPRYPQALREIFDPPILLFARGRVELLQSHLPGRGGNAPSHALRARGSRAPVRRPGARRPDHRQRHGARHRYRGAQGRAGGAAAIPWRCWDAAWTWSILRRIASWRRNWRSRG